MTSSLRRSICFSLIATVAVSGFALGSTASAVAAAPADSGHMHHEMSAPLEERLAAATPEQRKTAASLLAKTTKSLQRFEYEPDAVAAGFVAQPNGHRLIHYRNTRNRRDGRALDPNAPEGLVFARAASGELRLLGAVFTVHRGETAPTPGGPIFQWHTHDESCGSFLLAPGECPSTFRMLHVWTTDAVTITDPWIQPFRMAMGGAATGGHRHQPAGA